MLSLLTPIPDWWAVVFITVFAIFIQRIGDESLTEVASYDGENCQECL